jgi:hypothetical protein
MDLIYKIYSVFLYDHQLNHDYLILYNTYTNWANQISWDIGYEFSNTFNKIYNLDKSSSSFNEDSIREIKNAARMSNKLLVKNEGFLTLVKGRGTLLHNYNAYDIYWNETKSNININEYEVDAIWNVGNDSCSVYRICEEKDERERIIRNNKLNLLLTI